MIKRKKNPLAIRFAVGVGLKVNIVSTHATLVNEHRSFEKSKEREKKSCRFLEEAEKNALLSFTHTTAERKSFCNSQNENERRSCSAHRVSVQRVESL